MFSRAITSRSNRRRTTTSNTTASSAASSRLSSPYHHRGGSSKHPRNHHDAQSHESFLPTTATTFRPDDEKTTRRPPSQLPTFQAGNTCNKFLLGGQFHYPGKDHSKMRQRHQLRRRRRALWYRVFCSSPVRMGASAFVVAYVLLWHVLVPTTRILLDYGRMLSGGRSSHLIMDTSSFPLLLSITEERKQALRLQTERDHLLFGDSQRHEISRRIWEGIVPDWFHRNDGDQESPPHETVKLPLNVTKKLTIPEIEKSEVAAAAAAAETKVTHVDAAAKTTHETPPPRTNRTADFANGVGSRANATKAILAVGATTVKSSRMPSPKSDAALSTVPERVFEAPLPSTERTLFTMDELEPTSNCPSVLSESDIHTTLVVQTSLERVCLLHETCSRWKDPIVAVVHVSAMSTSSDTSMVSILGNATLACPQLMILRYPAKESEQDAGYPVNRLRNIGLDAVRTSHILVADVDFLPSMDLHEMIRSTLTAQPDLLESQQAIVVPAFERIPPEPCDTAEGCGAYLQRNSSFIPQTTDELRGCIADKHCSVFQQSINWEGHHSTHSESWLKGKWYDTKMNETTGLNVTRIRRVKCFDSMRYEPYVVLRWCPVSLEGSASTDDSDGSIQPVAPYYDERFHGYGKNKIQLISHLRFMGYRFSILPKGFIVHNPHPESSAKQAWNDVKENKLHATMDKLYPQYLRDVYDKYKETTRYIVDQCGRKNKHLQVSPKIHESSKRNEA